MDFLQLFVPVLPDGNIGGNTFKKFGGLLHALSNPQHCHIVPIVAQIIIYSLQRISYIFLMIHFTGSQPVTSLLSGELGVYVMLYLSK